MRNGSLRAAVEYDNQRHVTLCILVQLGDRHPSEGVLEDLSILPPPVHVPYPPAGRTAGRVKLEASSYLIGHIARGR